MLWQFDSFPDRIEGKLESHQVLTVSDTRDASLAWMSVIYARDLNGNIVPLNWVKVGSKAAQPPPKMWLKPLEVPLERAPITGPKRMVAVHPVLWGITILDPKDIEHPTRGHVSLWEKRINCDHTNPDELVEAIAKVYGSYKKGVEYGFDVVTRHNGVDYSVIRFTDRAVCALRNGYNTYFVDTVNWSIQAGDDDPISCGNEIEARNRLAMLNPYSVVIVGGVNRIGIVQEMLNYMSLCETA